jgi:hypothetical protein
MGTADGRTQSGHAITVRVESPAAIRDVTEAASRTEAMHTG